MTKTKVLLMITKSSWGGASKYVYDLARNLPKDQFEVAVILGGSGPLTERLKESGIRVIELHSLVRDVAMFENRLALINPWNIITSITKEIRVLGDVLSILKSERPDVLHVNSSKAGGLGAFAGRLAGTPRIVFTGHGWAFNEKRPWIVRVLFYFLHWLTVMLSHITIANSKKTKRDIDFLPFVKKRITVITPSIDITDSLPRKTAREKLGIPQDVFCIGTGTELHTNKGIDMVIEALPEVSGAYLAIIGVGDKEQELKELTHTLGIGDRVQFLGTVPNAREYMSAFDLFVLNSRTESFGYILLEAGLARLPVVTTNIGGIPEIIDHEINGLLIPTENPRATAKSIKRLIETPNEARKFGEALREKVVTTFSLEKMIAKTIEVYVAPTNSR